MWPALWWSVLAAQRLKVALSHPAHTCAHTHTPPPTSYASQNLEHVHTGTRSHHTPCEHTHPKTPYNQTHLTIAPLQMHAPREHTRVHPGLHTHMAIVHTPKVHPMHMQRHPYMQEHLKTQVRMYTPTHTQAASRTGICMHRPPQVHIQSVAHTPSTDHARTVDGACAHTHICATALTPLLSTTNPCRCTNTAPHACRVHTRQCTPDSTSYHTHLTTHTRPCTPDRAHLTTHTQPHRFAQEHTGKGGGRGYTIVIYILLLAINCYLITN